MKILGYFLLGVFLLNIPNQTFGNELTDSNKKYSLKQLSETEESSAVNVRFFQGFGYRHVGWDLDVAFQFRKYFSVGIGIAAHFNKTSFYSTSDEHNLNMWSMPLFAYATVFLINRENGALYIHGKFGRAFGIKTESVTPDKNFQAIMLDAGLGYQFKNFRSRKSIYFEIGQYYATAQGSLNSTYNSVIRYSDMEILNITGRIGLKF